MVSINILASPFKYDTPSFVTFMSMMLSSPKQMQAGIDYLIQTGKYTSETFQQVQFGRYELDLIPSHLWPGNTGIVWRQSAEAARTSLACIVNHETVDGRIPADGEDETTVPANRCDLLDALIQRCFTMPAAGEEDAGIPISIDVVAKPATDGNRDKHDISFHWELDSAGGPLLLYLTMICPYVPANRQK